MATSWRERTLNGKLVVVTGATAGQLLPAARIYVGTEAAKLRGVTPSAKSNVEFSNKVYIY